MRTKIFVAAVLTVSLFGCSAPAHHSPAPTQTAAPTRQVRHTPRTEAQRRVMATRVALKRCHPITDDTQWEDCLTATYREQTGHTLTADEYTTGTTATGEFFQVDAPDPVQTIVATRPTGMPRCGAEDGGPVLPCFRYRNTDGRWNVFSQA